MTRYVTDGAGVSVPSESKAFYFSGMRGDSWGPIARGDGSANTSASSLISADMGTMGEQTWSNETLPSNVTSRASAQLVWLPVSKEGVLAVIGGVKFPEVLYSAGLSQKQTEDNVGKAPRIRMVNWRLTTTSPQPAPSF